MAELDTTPAPWLQRAWSPRETFDPTPWLQERYRRQVEQAKLPLQLQGLALQNQAQQLQIEHQGVVNDEFNDELKKEAEDLPIYRQHALEASNYPGGALEMGAPSFQSKKYNDLWKQRQAMDANTMYNEAMHQALVSQTKQAAEVSQELGVIVPRNPDGTFDEQKLAELATKANLQRAAREQEAKLGQIKARQEHYYDENGNLVIRGGGAGGYAPDVTWKRAEARRQARQAIINAKTPEEKAEKELFYKDLIHEQDLQFPDKTAQVQVQILRDELRAATSAYYQTGASDAKLLENVNRLKAEIKSLGVPIQSTEPSAAPKPRLRWNPQTEQLE